MSYTVNDLAVSPTIRTKVLTSLVKAAGTVLIEAQGDRSIPHYAKRTELASKILDGPESFVPKFIWPILSNSAIVSAGFSVTDSDLEFQIMTVWDTLAGVTASDKQPAV